MLFLSHLSEVDAKWWLNASELLLLGATVLLVVGLIGELPESESWKKGALYKLAKAAVVFGVIGEFFGDAGIFETTGRFQELFDAQIRPYALDSNQIKRVGSATGVSPPLADLPSGASAPPGARRASYVRRTASFSLPYWRRSRIASL
jgi:hypothetical protein